MARSRTAGMVLPALLFLISTGLFLWGSCPTLYWRDSSEFQWAGFALGVPHPPGSPAYVILAKAASFLPLGSIGFRTNALSAFAAAAAIFLLCQLLGALVEGPRPVLSRALPAAGAALLLAPSPNYRLYAGVAEAYAPGALGAAAVLLVACRWFTVDRREEPDDRFAFAAFFLVGVAAGLHVSAGVYALSLFLAMAASRPGRVFRPRMFFGLSLFLISGLSVFLFVPLRAAGHPTMDWGRPDTPYRLRYHLLDQKDWPQPRPSAPAPLEAASEYKKPWRASDELRPLVEAASGRLRTPRGLLEAAARRHRSVLGFIPRELGFLAAPLAAGGAAWLLARRRPGLLLLLLLVAYGHGVFSVVIARWGTSYGYFPVLWIVALLAGLGVAGLADLGAKLPRAWGRAARWAMPAAVIAALAFARIPSIDSAKGRYWSTYRFGMELFRTLPPRAVVLAAHYWPILGYLRFGEGVRPDVNVLYRNEAYQSLQFYPDESVQPDLLLPARGLKARPSMRAFLEANLSARPFFWQSEWDDGLLGEPGPLEDFGLVARGLWLEVRPREESAAAEDPKGLDEFFESWSRLIAGARKEGGKLDLDEREDLATVPFRTGQFLLMQKDCREAKRWLALSESLLEPGVSYVWVTELKRDIERARQGEAGPCPGTGLDLVDVSTVPAAAAGGAEKQGEK